jgi:FlaA1/EpsC-like NDP-sugar epimerase
LYDTLIVLGTFFLAHLMRYNFAMTATNISSVVTQSILVVLVYLWAFLFTRSYRSIIRHSGINDSIRILKATGYATIGLIGIQFIFRGQFSSGRWIPPLSVIIIIFLFAQLFMVWSRFIIKSLYHDFIAKDSRTHMKVLIYGAGMAGMHTRNALKGDPSFRHEIVAFIDDNASKINKMLEGIPVVSPERGLSPDFIARNQITLLIISIQGLELDYKNTIIERGLELDLKVKVVPSINNWINGELSSNQLREVRIEELLEREPIKLDNDHVIRDIRDRVVMVTGAAGSIGSELVRQLMQYKPSRLVLVDQAESALYDLQYEINSNNTKNDSTVSVIFLVASVKDRFRMDDIFKTYKPQYVFHAAAYKHVPLMEENPYEALMVNVFGTRVIADLSVNYRVQKFVMVSTDKAVNPTNVMGASKRLAEIYIQSLSNGTTQFITTRFGNVLGSNGSVIPLFKKQIESGGPVTVTHKDITRFFMTIPEACNLVLEAGVMGKGGEIFIFDMGKTVRIYDLAHKMIRLSGLVPDKDIRIIETGLRPGEKLNEELLANDEHTIHTHHPKILLAKVVEYDKKKVLDSVLELSKLIYDGDLYAIVGKMKEIIPEYISNNSVYERLDKKKR